MGFRMARNLAKKNVHVVAYDIRPDQTNLLKNEFGDLITSSLNLSNIIQKDTDAVITMLPGPKNVLEAYLESENSLLSQIKKQGRSDIILVDASTIDPETARHVQKQAQSIGVRFYDTPVSGGVKGAEEGTLTFMVGSVDKEAFEHVSKLLSFMGKNIVDCGTPGNGQVAKLCNNVALSIQMIAISEAMNLGIHLGIEAKTLSSIFNSSTARCWSSDTCNPVPGIMPNVPSSKGYSGGFGVDLMAKDLGLAVNAANNIKVPLQLGAQAHQIYNNLSYHGLGKKDFSVVYDFLQKK